MTAPTKKAGYRERQLEQIDKFVTHIKKISQEPGQRAGLRRGVGRRPETAYRSHAYVANWVGSSGPDDRTYEAREWAFYAVAAMIAAQPGRARRDDESEDDPPGDDVAAEPDAGATADAPRSNLGASLARGAARGAAGQRSIAEGTAEKRLHLLIRQGLAGVHRHLPATVRHLRSANVTIDWAVLIRDLSRWTDARDKVAKDWLQAFYRELNPLRMNFIDATPGSTKS